MKTLFLATSNKDKIDEISNLLSDLTISVLSINDFADYPKVVEDCSTLEGNAVKKAKEFSAYFKLPALADDTGLEVSALNGAPGIFSARYAGEKAGYQENVKKLLLEMIDVPGAYREAQFRTVMALAYNGEIETVEGICIGRITREQKGSAGFGYDPVFFVPELGKTFAESSFEEKNKISHRGKALELMKHLLIAKLGA